MKKIIFFSLLSILIIIGLFLIQTKGLKAIEFDSFNLGFPKEDKLKRSVLQVLNGEEGDFAIAIKNLKTGEKYYLNENKTFISGSLYKLWVMAETYRQMERGLISEDEVLTEDIKVLNEKFNIDESVAELTEGTINLSVTDSLKQMITISHNYAALLLTKRIRLLSVADFLTDFGFNGSSVGIDGDTPKTTAADTAIFFEKLYLGELGTKENTDKMLELLKKQQLNDKLPKYLPGVTIAHKTGELDFLSHDGGIIFTPSGDYIIVVLSETNNPPDAEEVIGKINKAVYDYFANKQ